MSGENPETDRPTIKSMIIDAMKALKGPADMNDVLDAVARLHPNAYIDYSSVTATLSKMRARGILKTVGSPGEKSSSGLMLFELAEPAPPSPPPPPNQRAMALHVMSQMAGPADKHAIEAAMREQYPHAVIGKMSVHALLSRMADRGELTVTRPFPHEPNACFLYGLPKLEPVMTHPQPKAYPVFRHRHQLSIRVPDLLVSAIQALAEYREEGAIVECDDDTMMIRGLQRDDVTLMVRSMFREFIEAAPYANSRGGFFWVKFWPVPYNPRNIRLPDSPESRAIYGSMQLILKDRRLVDHGVAVLSNRTSRASMLDMAIIGYTALVWYLMSRTTSVERGIPSVSRFIDHAVGNYTTRGLGLRDVFPAPRSDDFRAGADAPAPGPVPPEASPASPAEPPHASGSRAVQEPVSGAADDLRISIHLSRALSERLLMAVLQGCSRR